MTNPPPNFGPLTPADREETANVFGYIVGRIPPRKGSEKLILEWVRR